MRTWISWEQTPRHHVTAVRGAMISKRTSKWGEDSRLIFFQSSAKWLTVWLTGHSSYTKLYSHLLFIKSSDSLVAISPKDHGQWLFVLKEPVWGSKYESYNMTHIIWPLLDKNSTKMAGNNPLRLVQSALKLTEPFFISIGSRLSGQTVNRVFPIQNINWSPSQWLHPANEFYIVSFW